MIIGAIVQVETRQAKTCISETEMLLEATGQRRRISVPEQEYLRKQRHLTTLRRRSTTFPAAGWRGGVGGGRPIGSLTLRFRDSCAELKNGCPPESGTGADAKMAYERGAGKEWELALVTTWVLLPKVVVAVRRALCFGHLMARSGVCQADNNEMGEFGLELHGQHVNKMLHSW